MVPVPVSSQYCRALLVNTGNRLVNFWQKFGKQWELESVLKIKTTVLYCARIRVAAHGRFLGVRGGGMRYRYEDSAVLVRYSCRCSAGICKIPRSTGLLEFDCVQAGSVTK